MYTKIDEEMVLNFLERNYPVSRVKYKTKFKRAIITDDGSSFFLSDKNVYPKLKNKLVEILEIVFCFDTKFLLKMVDEFLPTK